MHGENVCLCECPAECTQDQMANSGLLLIGQKKIDGFFCLFPIHDMHFLFSVCVALDGD